VLDAPPEVDADGVKTPKNVYQETDRDLTEMRIIAQNGFIKPVSVLNVLSIRTVNLALSTHFVAGAWIPVLALKQLMIRLMKTDVKSSLILADVLRRQPQVEEPLDLLALDLLVLVLLVLVQLVLVQLVLVQLVLVQLVLVQLVLDLLVLLQL
jgi:hypothetical protein